MNAQNDDTNPTDFLLEMAKHQGGVACATVQDGHVLIFSKQALTRLLEQATLNDKGQIIVFVKRNDFKG